MLFPNDVVVHRELVLALIGFRCFRVQHLVSVFGLLNLLQWQVSTLGSNFHLLGRVGVGQRNPDTQALAGSDVLHRECIVKTKMALILSESWQIGKHEKHREKGATKETGSFYGGS